MKKFATFIQEIGTIMYVGGILSHIVIGASMASSDATLMFHIYSYKEISAYILILPGLGLKILSDIILYTQFSTLPNWFKIKIATMIFLTANAFIFLVPMMPELVELAKNSIPTGTVSPAFIDTEGTEMLVGISNVIPLLLEIIMWSFKPKIGKL
ncbi:MAG: enoyl-CoA hydratase [Gammaproteobacteria bacterium]|nr:MAG: enoyl-CoA hydratase [Gammaproteobacteria bacterium]